MLQMLYYYMVGMGVIPLIAIKMVFVPSSPPYPDKSGTWPSYLAVVDRRS